VNNSVSVNMSASRDTRHGSIGCGGQFQLSRLLKGIGATALVEAPVDVQAMTMSGATLMQVSQKQLRMDAAALAPVAQWEHGAYRAAGGFG
jgi:hypothetical protein